MLTPNATTPVTLFTAAYLHLTDSHLLGNVVGYGLGVLSAYLLCLDLGERRWFWLSSLVLVLGLPILVNWTSVRVLWYYFGQVSAPIRGFSGVAAGFVGFALAALLAFVGQRTDRPTVIYSGLAVILMLLWEILIIYSGEIPLASTGLVVLGVSLCLVAVGRQWRQRGIPGTRADWLDAGLIVLVFVGTLFLIAWLVAHLFPADVVDDGRVTNIYAHAIGFGYGFVISGWGYRYWRTTYPRKRYAA